MKKSEFKAKKIVGIEIKTRNENNQAEKDMTVLWGTFINDNIMEKIPNKENLDIYCIYTNYESDFTGEYSSIVVVQKDAPGVVAYITKCLSELGINIAFMRLFRESKGNTAYTIVESDDLVPEDIADTIRKNKNVYNVMVVQM